MAMMQKARNAIVQDPSLITKAVAAMEKAGEPWPKDMQRAIASLRVGHWVYLRDTSGYSVFLETGDLQAGDLVFFKNDTSSSVSHTGIYAGGGSFIHASSSAGKVIRSSISTAYWTRNFVNGRRVF